MTETFVTAEIEGAIGTITVRRPKALNALNAVVVGQLFEAATALVENPAVRVIQVTGEGDRAFVAGADITEFVGASPAEAMAIALRIKKVTDLLSTSPKPVVAVVNGFCLGGGFELALACDIRIASSKALFGLPEIKLGILPGGGGTVRLSKIAGSSVARMLAMTGDQITAQRAYDLGLVASVHEPADLQAAATELAGRLAASASIALAQLKASLNIAVDAPTAVALDAEIKAFALCYATADQEEGAKAFLEKRKPDFKGR